MSYNISCLVRCRKFTHLRYDIFCCHVAKVICTISTSKCALTRFTRKYQWKPHPLGAWNGKLGDREKSCSPYPQDSGFLIILIGLVIYIVGLICRKNLSRVKVVALSTLVSVLSIAILTLLYRWFSLTLASVKSIVTHLIKRCLLAIYQHFSTVKPIHIKGV